MIGCCEWLVISLESLQGLPNTLAAWCPCHGHPVDASDERRMRRGSQHRLGNARVTNE